MTVEKKLCGVENKHGGGEIVRLFGAVGDGAAGA